MKIYNYSIWTSGKSTLPEYASIDQMTIEGLDQGYSLMIYFGELYFITRLLDEPYYKYFKINADFEFKD